MWQFLVAAAVAGSGLFARHLFNGDGDGDQSLTAGASPEKTRRRVRVIRSSVSEDLAPKFQEKSDDLSSGLQDSVMEEDDSIFRFSSKVSSCSRQSLVQSGGRKLRKGKPNGEKTKNGVEVRRLERRFSICLKRRKIGKGASVKGDSCCSRENSLFSWGLGVGIMYMMSAGKSEISKLNLTVDDTAKVVQELKAELCKRKTSCIMQLSSFVDETGESAGQSEGNNIQPVQTDLPGESFSPHVMKDSSPTVTDDGDYSSSVLTEEPAPEMLEMDQLEAELEYELQKLPGCFIEDLDHNGMKSSGYHENEVSLERYYKAENSVPTACQLSGVLPSELDQKLRDLLLERQESQIVELESELHISQSKLREKEIELQALKDCVKRLSEFSLASVSDDEAEFNEKQEVPKDWSCINKVIPNSKNSMAGMKRAIDYESCEYQVR